MDAEGIKKMKERLDGPDRLDLAFRAEGLVTTESVAKSTVQRRKLLQKKLSSMRGVSGKTVGILAQSQREDEFLVNITGLRVPEKHDVKVDRFEHLSDDELDGRLEELERKRKGCVNSGREDTGIGTSGDEGEAGEEA